MIPRRSGTSWSHPGLIFAASRAFTMPQEKAKARKTVRAAQKQFERERNDSQRARRQAFAKAQKAGLSLREIAEEAGLHHSSVADIIDGK